MRQCGQSREIRSAPGDERAEEILACLGAGEKAQQPALRRKGGEQLQARGGVMQRVIAGQRVAYVARIEQPLETGALIGRQRHDLHAASLASHSARRGWWA